MLELAGAAHGVHLDVDHFDRGEVLVDYAVVLVFELLTAELLAASEKMVGNDLHGTHLPTIGEFLRTAPWVRLLLGALVYELGDAIGLRLCGHLPAEPLRARLPGWRTRQAQVGIPRGPVVGHDRAQRDAPGQLCPIAWVFSQSTDSIAFISCLHLLLWAVGFYFGVRLVLIGARYLGVADRGYLVLWLIILTLVSLQMMTTLRPIVGDSEQLLPTEKKFFLNHWLELFAN